MPIRSLVLVAPLAALTALGASGLARSAAPPPAKAGPIAVAAGGRSSAKGARKHPRPTLARKSAAVAAPPNDPLWGASWGLRAVGAPAIWRLGEGSPQVVVAVVDSGVDPTQPDLAGTIVPGWNALAGNADTTDAFGHGTEVAGVIAARANNGVGGSGYCPRCAIMPVKVLDATGHGPGARIAAGIEWATDHGADVINLSLVLTNRDSAVTAAVAAAVAHGILVVASAGNDGGTSANYPAAEPGVISVAANDASLAIYPWSTTGSWVSVAAPGCNETGTLGHGFQEFCGTSSAAAAVSGLLALTLSRSGSADAVRAALPAPVVTGRVPPIDGRALLAAVARAARTGT
jgi:subtilisin family serine protease